jgi:WD40 repeat protein
VAGDPPRSYPLPTHPLFAGPDFLPGWDLLKFSPTGDTFAINITLVTIYGVYGNGGTIGQGKVEIRNTADGSLRAAIGEEMGGADDLPSSPDGQILAGLLGISTLTAEPVSGKPGVIIWHNYVVTRSQSLRLFDAADGTLLQTYPLRDVPANLLSFSGNGRCLAVAYIDGTVEVWDVLNNVRARTIPVGTERLAAIALSPDGRVLGASRAWDAGGSGMATSLSVWDVPGNRLLQRFDVSDVNYNLTLAFSPVGARYAYGGSASSAVTVAETPDMGPPRTGDVDADGAITVNDAVLGLRIAAGLPLPIFSEESVADANRDLTVDIADAILILKSIVFGTPLE